MIKNIKKEKMKHSQINHAKVGGFSHRTFRLVRTQQQNLGGWLN